MLNRHGILDENFDEGVVTLFKNYYDSFIGATRQLHNNLDIHELGSGYLMKSLLNSVGLNSPYFCSIPMVVYNCKLLALEEYHLPQYIRTGGVCKAALTVLLPGYL